MTSQEFVLWLKGFSEGVHEFNITPKQWDILKDKLAEVKDDITSSPFPFGVPNTTPNMIPFVQPVHIPPPSIDPYNPYKIYCDITGSSGTWKPNFAVTTTPGYGSITIANPNIASFGTITSTATSLPSGSTITYTNGGNDIKD